jgi:hypothetical protein
MLLKNNTARENFFFEERLRIASSLGLVLNNFNRVIFFHFFFEILVVTLGTIRKHLGLASLYNSILCAMMGLMFTFHSFLYIFFFYNSLKKHRPL